MIIMNSKIVKEHQYYLFPTPRKKRKTSVSEMGVVFLDKLDPVIFGCPCRRGGSPPLGDLAPIMASPDESIAAKIILAWISPFIPNEFTCQRTTEQKMLGIMLLDPTS
jgi:hypothetical protein